jgi:CRP-like cAMP-binding protein
MPNELKQGLKSIQGFSALSEAVLEQLVPFASERVVRAGETIFCQGEPSPYCFGVLSGEVVIQHVSKDARFTPKVLGVVGPGGLFGESAILEDNPRAAMASASKDGKLLAIRGSQLRQWIQKNPETGQLLLLALLQSALGRLHRTSQELAVIYGVGRLLGSDKPFPDQLSATLDFLKGSLEGVDDLVFYQRNAYWEEFSPFLSLPALTDLPAIPLQNEMIQKVSAAGITQSFDPKTLQTQLAALKLPWETRLAMAVIPLFDWDKARDPLQGLLFLASGRQANAFAAEKQLLLTSVAHPLAEALSRHSRQEDALAQARLQQSKKSFPQ